MSTATAVPADLELLHGVDFEPSAGRWLYAGPVEALLLDGDLRYVRRGNTEVARRIQVAVRSEAWDTVAGVRSEERVEQRDDSFSVSFESLHRDGELVYRWRCTIDGASDGTITYAMDGVAECDFLYRRIGLCVLHPTEVFAGAAFEASSPASRSAGELPASVGPQRFDGETFPPLFDAFDRLRMVSRDGVAVEFAFEGDLFEMEDQRNWTDASFKTYSRSPVTRAEPWPLSAGTELSQRVTVSSHGAPATPRASRSPTVSLGDAVIGRVPAIGAQLESGGLAHGAREIEALRELRLAHLRVDVHLTRERWRGELDRGAALALELGCALELAVFAGADPVVFDALAAALGDAPPVARVLVFAEDAEVTPPELVDAARTALGDVPIGGGTNVYFAELNRVEAFPTSFDAVAYPVTPQVHSDDDLSLVETPAAQADTVRRARLLAPSAAIAVTPITLKPRYNPDAPDALTPRGELPANVDVRQMALITAAWTLASVRRLGEAGAASATYFETIGWRGLLEPDPLPPRDAPFPSVGGMLFPVYHLLAELAPLSGLELLECTSSEPLTVEAMQLASAQSRLVLVANVTPRPQRVGVSMIGRGAVIRRLTVEAVRAHLGENLRDGWNRAQIGDGGRLELELSGYEISILRWDPGDGLEEAIA
jgi:D-apionolactonase